MLHVLADIKLHPGKRDAFLTEFRRLMPQVLAEQGCLEYGPAIDLATDISVQQLAGEDVVVIVEEWESLDALKAHLAAPHMAAYRERVKPFVTAVRLHILSNLPDPTRLAPRSFHLVHCHGVRRRRRGLAAAEVWSEREPSRDWVGNRGDLRLSCAIPPDHFMVRGFCCLLCIDPLFRVLDYARQLRAGTVKPVAWRAYCTFLIPFPFWLTVFGQKRRVRQTPHSAADLLRLVASLSACAMAVILCLQSYRVAALRESFLLDHVIKSILFLIVVQTASQAQAALERLTGFYAAPLINHAYRARTPAEFWLRFNQRVRQWLYFNVFIPCGGQRAPVVGVICVFLVSAIFHEFFFALATSRLDGYQFAFFMLQIPAVILSPRLERLARRGLGGRFAAHALTLLWFAGTSLLFFHGLDRVFPFFYVSQPWLP